MQDESSLQPWPNYSPFLFYIFLLHFFILFINIVEFSKQKFFFNTRCPEKKTKKKKTMHALLSVSILKVSYNKFWCI